MANVSPTWAAYQVNGGPTQTGRPYAVGPKPPPYTPYFVFATLGRYPVEGEFGRGGPNDLVVTFRDTVPADVPHRFTIVIPEDVSVDDSLILYAFRDVVMLLNSRGTPLRPDQQLIPGTPVGSPTGPGNHQGGHG